MLLCATLFFITVLGMSLFSRSVLGIERFFLAFISLALILLWSIELISDQFTGSGFNASVIFHLMYGFGGAGFKDFTKQIILSSTLFFIPFAMWAYIFCLNSIKPLLSRPIILIFSMSGSYLVVQHPVINSLKNMIDPAKSDELLISHFVSPQVKARPKKLPNIVWIYAESLERTYLNEEEFPGLTPNLKVLASKSLDFTNISQVGATGWTIAGMVASQCGFPLITTGSGGNSMRDVPKFLPGAKCLGDVLASEGYQLEFMGGADPYFAGKGKFLKDHGFSKVQGFSDLSPNLSDALYRSDWGLFDDSLFSFASKRYHELVKINKPFGLFLLTLDTHHPVGHIPKSCQGYEYGDGQNEILNAVYCSDKLISEFIDSLDNEDTLVVIASDHLAMRNTASDRLQKQDRKNLLLFYWPSRLRNSINARADGTFSSGVTALDIMGFKIEGIGLGRSLLGMSSTLLEKIPNPENVISSWEEELRKLWQIPKGPVSIEVDPVAQNVTISSIQYHFPIIIDISKANEQVRMFFEDADDPLSSVIIRLGSESRSVWFDRCDLVNSVFDKRTPGDPHKVCIWDDGVQKVTVIDRLKEYKL